ncbi:MAG TPA: hypothetical protein VF543_07570 [Pyrinomonadaceae bacterium]|jgi:4-amino-4-deoxy-L-arabinose transferase-like glycosyltransferase
MNRIHITPESYAPEIRLMLAAITLHLFLALTIQLIGTFALIPAYFDSHGVFTYDGSAYRAEARALAEMFYGRGFFDWAHTPSPLHVRLYSICYIDSGPLSGFDVLAVEPLNLSYYLLTLSLIYAICREVFSRRAGLLAASIVAFWPSFLLHTVQHLKDPLYIACILGLVLVLVSCLTRNYSILSGIALGLGGALLTLLLWPVRSNMWGLTPIFIGGATVLLILRMLREKNISFGNILCAILLIIAATWFQDIFRGPEPRVNVASSAPPASAVQVGEQAPARDAKPETASYLSSIEAKLGYTAREIDRLRFGFIRNYISGGSNIDTDVRFYSVGDLIRYFPRALAIGFFSPFPDMWLSPGKEVGHGGRLLAAFETLLIYFNFPLMIFGLWKARRRWGAWVLIMISSAALSVLAMIVTNIGALYRMRFAYWMLLVIIGANGMIHLREEIMKRRESARAVVNTQ